MTRFSANLGFLWTDLALPDAIRAAHAAGFDAVECHWPYAVPPAAVRTALQETGLPMLGLNTARGRPGESGLAALPGREAEARAAVDQALDYAERTDTQAIHVMAGFAEGPAAEAAFLETLAFACQSTSRMILIEPLNRYDVPGYFLSTIKQARTIIAAVDAPNLKLMFDCYHVGLTEDDVLSRLSDLMPIIGHIQFAAIPDRGPPDTGEIDFDTVFRHLDGLGWDRPLGAEYRSPGATDASLEWLSRYR